MKKQTKAEKEYRIWKKKFDLFHDVIGEHEDGKTRLEEHILALKTNPQYRAICPKNSLERAERKLKVEELLLEALELYHNKLIDNN